MKKKIGQFITGLAIIVLTVRFFIWIVFVDITLSITFFFLLFGLILQYDFRGIKTTSSDATKIVHKSTRSSKS